MVAITSPAFKENAARALADARLQKALGTAKAPSCSAAPPRSADLPEFEALRDIGRDIKNHTLAHLDLYLEAYEAKVIAAGGQVHWCARRRGGARRSSSRSAARPAPRTVTKGKSMIAEEIGSTTISRRNGIAPVETDLGEYIIQLRNELPSHIIAPAVHLNREDRSSAIPPRPHRLLDPTAICRERRDSSWPRRAACCASSSSRPMSASPAPIS